ASFVFSPDGLGFYILYLYHIFKKMVSDFLADKPFFMGDQPTSLDATAYAYVGNVIKAPYTSPIVDYVLQRSNLCQHYERMTQQFFNSQSLSQVTLVHC
ncbi:MULTISPECIES: glutathione S-transferase C-terminal domain-containing protein, partial [unclassified Microcoleus]|uniref:glutathione S-transferase C-terminal domain-containing protein n=1 Tax=unclassified Microcoleus TaxID=2642155 RepID=UPI002FD13FD2